MTKTRLLQDPKHQAKIILMALVMGHYHKDTCSAQEREGGTQIIEKSDMRCKRVDRFESTTSEFGLNIDRHQILPSIDPTFTMFVHLKTSSVMEYIDLYLLSFMFYGNTNACLLGMAWRRFRTWGGGEVELCLANSVVVGRFTTL